MSSETDYVMKQLIRELLDLQKNSGEGGHISIQMKPDNVDDVDVHFIISITDKDTYYPSQVYITPVTNGKAKFIQKGFNPPRVFGDVNAILDNIRTTLEEFEETSYDEFIERSADLGLVGEVIGRLVGFLRYANLQDYHHYEISGLKKRIPGIIRTYQARLKSISSNNRYAQWVREMCDKINEELNEVTKNTLEILNNYEKKYGDRTYSGSDIVTEHFRGWGVIKKIVSKYYREANAEEPRFY